MFNPSREEVRRFFTETWRKQRAGEILTPLEAIAADWILEHPEYHNALTDEEVASATDYTPEGGQTNPFLHLSMHLAISEQLSIDQPSGISQRFQRLLLKTGDEHVAAHQLMECLAEMIWQAQRDQKALDATVYFGCLDRQENISG